MTDFTPIRRLRVSRCLSTGAIVPVGELAQNRDDVFFQYSEGYLREHPSLSPFQMPFDGSVHRAPRDPHEGLHGVFADSLPDGWGRLLMDRVFRRQGIAASQLTAMDRLSFIGERGVGALRYSPASPPAPAPAGEPSIWELGTHAEKLFDGEGEELLAFLAEAGSSGGARPKASVYLPADAAASRTRILPEPGLEPWIVKFTSASLPLGHEEGLCEAAYLRLAQNAGIDTPDWQLLQVPAAAPTNATAWLAQRRFDCTPPDGRLHMHSLCGLLDADFRAPSMDYEDLIRASQALCASPSVGQTQFIRAAFNLFAVNQDDHTRNWSFLQDDAGNWRPSPFYDVTFCPTPHDQHTTAFLGHGSAPPRKAMQHLAGQGSFASWSHAREALERVVDALGNWPRVASELGIRPDTRHLIDHRLDQTRKANRALLA
ncbi:MAG: type II toxin-antitoxin system HipA family toxin [Gammaproteobacteria bacterium]|nr:type II toxin-antitoxin system HipA family toxin [Gammaproteobacteria bacterium]MYB38899.1 type II toxin-antitoxin system HipA family toxin [Gammaproteobacteria bacterium]